MPKAGERWIENSAMKSSINAAFFGLSSSRQLLDQTKRCLRYRRFVPEPRHGSNLWDEGICLGANTDGNRTSSALGPRCKVKAGPRNICRLQPLRITRFTNAVAALSIPFCRSDSVAPCESVLLSTWRSLLVLRCGRLARKIEAFSSIAEICTAWYRNCTRTPLLATHPIEPTGRQVVAAPACKSSTQQGRGLYRVKAAVPKGQLPVGFS